MTAARRWQPVLSLFIMVVLLLIAIQPVAASTKPVPSAQGPQSIPGTHGISLRTGVTVAPARDLAARVNVQQATRDGQTINGVLYEVTDQYGNYYDLQQNLQLPRARSGSATSGSLNQTVTPHIAPLKKITDPPMPGLTSFWEGLNQGANRTNFTFGFLPSDVNGDTSGNVYDHGYYVQTVNALFSVWDYSQVNVYGAWPKTIVPPTPINALFTGFGGACEYTNDGDPIVLYDEQANRWLISQFALPYLDYTVNPFADPFYQCIAISKTGDPSGLWNLYEFGGFQDMNDYPKFGIWNDGYYMTVNQFDKDAFTWEGAGIMVFNRNKMLAGLPADWFYFDPYSGCTATEDVCYLGGMLPADAEGTPPPPGTPGYVMQFDDDAWGYSADQVQIWTVDVDWVHPANTTLSHTVDLPVNAFDSEVCAGYSRSCIPQPGTAVGLDAISDRLMYRLQYRNFGTYRTMVANHTVDVDGLGHAGIRWYELRDSGAGWSVYQQGDYAPDSDNRWMGSIAMDSAGNIALGYSVSSSASYPGIRYAGRLASDPLGTLPLTEGAIADGGGSQTSSSNRWGDYSSMSVAPDGCNFVYTNQYLRGTTPAEWYSRMGNFSFPNCVPTVASRSGRIQDGWILESTETSGTGGTKNNTATTFVVGDSAADQQYRSILSFNTSALADDAVITKVTLKIRKAGLVGTDPFNTHGSLLVDIRKGGFAGNPALQLGDFNAAASLNAAGTVPNVPVSGWYSSDLSASAFPFINATGITQFRLRFQKDDNDDRGADFLKFYSGNASASLQPVLVIEYNIPAP